jgi:conjugal transfer pilus assembly protein TraB
MKKQKIKEKKAKSLIGNKTGFMNALLVTGASAPTFSEGTANPKPVILSIMGNEYLANGFKANLDGCFAMATASGNIITSRAEMLITKITCNYKKNGKMYEISQSVKGWVIGADGKYGVKGLLVDSSGKILTKAMVMGILQGIGNLAAQTASNYVAQQTAANATTGNTPSYTSIATNNLATGVGTGISNGFNVLTDYYKKILDAYFPYVDVKAGKKVTILLNGGEGVTEKQVNTIDIHKAEEEETSIEDSSINIKAEDY